jgi:hypothetical protein
MIRRVGILILGTALGYVVFMLPMGFLVKETPLAVVAIAAGLQLATGILVLLGNQSLRDKPPEVKIVGVLLTTVFRMVATLGGGAFCYYSIPLVKEHAFPFVSWVIVFYLVTLFIETRLLYTDSSGQTPSPPASENRPG